MAAWFCVAVFNAEADAMEKAVNSMDEAVQKHGWDGEWYLRAYDFYGNKIGSNENEEGKIFIDCHLLHS